MHLYCTNSPRGASVGSYPAPCLSAIGIRFEQPRVLPVMSGDTMAKRQAGVTDRRQTTLEVTLRRADGLGPTRTKRDSALNERLRAWHSGVK